MAKLRKDEEKSDEGPGFEQALERLEEIVERMEGGDLALEQAMVLFEEGVRLGQSCQKRLDEAERKITLLMEKADGSLEETPYDPDAAPAPEAPPARSKPAPARRAAAPAKPPPPRQPSFGEPGGPDDIPF